MLDIVPSTFCFVAYMYASRSRIGGVEVSVSSTQDNNVFSFLSHSFLALRILKDWQARVSLFVMVKSLAMEKGRKCVSEAIYYICRPAIFGIASEGDVEGVVSGLCVCLQALGSSGAFYASMLSF